MPAINLWSSPRNISTAFMYSFAQRSDTAVFDEPLYAHYLKHTTSEAQHPATAEVLASQNNNGEQVVNELILQPQNKPISLFKQMTHHLIHLDWSFMQHTLNVLLIRNPRAIISSFTKVIPNPTIDDVGIAKQVQLMHYLQEHNVLQAIVDTTDLLQNPEGMLIKLCQKLDIPFYKEMLSWEAGPRPEDGVWAPYWYSNVHASTGFAPYQPKKYPLEGANEDLAQACQTFYDQLYNYALHP